jgi:hypothetical protein
MTTLTKPVRRVSAAQVREQGRPRNIVVILRPPGTLGFRAAGCRREYQLPIEACYTLAVRAHVLAETRTRAQAQARKQNRRNRP